MGLNDVTLFSHLVSFRKTDSRLILPNEAAILFTAMMANYWTVKVKSCEAIVALLSVTWIVKL